MKKEYEFKDLFDADQNLNKQGQNQREKITVFQLRQLESIFPNKLN